MAPFGIILFRKQHKEQELSEKIYSLCVCICLRNVWCDLRHFTKVVHGFGYGLRARLGRLREHEKLSSGGYGRGMAWVCPGMTGRLEGAAEGSEATDV